MILFIVFYLSTVWGVGQPCTFYATESGTCIEESTCQGAFGPSSTALGTTGCERDGPTIRCCATNIMCTKNTANDGRCIDDAASCPGTRYKSSEGASGCNKFPSNVKCCVPTAGQTTTSVRPGVPTGSPTPRPTPPPGSTQMVGSVCSFEGIEGTCQNGANCRDGLHTSSSLGATGCNMIRDNDVRCCTKPRCSIGEAGHVWQGTCLATATACPSGARRVGTTNCRRYPANVNCCLNEAPPTTVSASTPAPPTAPGVIMCSFKGLSGTCQEPAECDGLVTPSSKGANGCQSAGSKTCCTRPTCSYREEGGGVVDGICADREAPQNHRCSTGPSITSIGGAVGCGSYRNGVTCCLSREPLTARPTPVPPTPMLTRAPTPYVEPVPVNQGCTYLGRTGKCALSRDCKGITAVQGNGAIGCDESIPSNMCCLSFPCEVMDAMGVRQGNCRVSRQCNTDGLEAVPIESGTCPMTYLTCCVEPREKISEGDAGNIANNTPQDLNCRVTKGPAATAPGTCYEAGECTGDFMPATSKGDTWEGCVNQAQFADLGCCVSEAAKNAVVPVVGDCTVGKDPKCGTARICKEIEGKPTCVVDENMDCKESGGCLLSGQECVPDGPDGKNVCGPPRTCRTLGCSHRQGATCTNVGDGIPPQCVTSDDCFSKECAFGEECRPNTRGSQFPPICAPKDNKVVVDGPSQGPEEDGGLSTLVWALIIGSGVILLLVCCCIVAAVIIAATRSDEPDQYAYGGGSVEMRNDSYHPTSFQQAPLTSDYPGAAQGQSYGAPGSYPNTMAGGSLQGSGYAGQTFSTAAEFQRGGTGGGGGYSFSGSQQGGYGGGTQPGYSMGGGGAANPLY